jgi:hypothetical protein
MLPKSSCFVSGRDLSRPVTKNTSRFRAWVRTRIIQPRRGDLNVAQDVVRRTESWVTQEEMNSPVGTAETGCKDSALYQGTTFSRAVTDRKYVGLQPLGQSRFHPEGMTMK